MGDWWQGLAPQATPGSAGCTTPSDEGAVRAEAAVEVHGDWCDRVDGLASQLCGARVQEDPVVHKDWEVLP